MSVNFRSLAFLGFPNHKVSDDGRVFSRMVYGSKLKRVGTEWWEMKLMGKQRPYVRLCPETGYVGRWQIAWLVAEAFIGPRPEGLLVCHKDDNPWNNNLNNLYYGTHSQNRFDAKRNGRMDLGENHKGANMTNDQIREIKRMSANGIKQIRIAEKFNIRVQKVSKIIRGEIYANII